jgi:hypothetical protein
VQRSQKGLHDKYSALNKILCIQFINSTVDQPFDINIYKEGRMASFGILRGVALVRINVSDEHSEEISRSLRRLLVTANVVPTPPILVTLMIEELSS